MKEDEEDEEDEKEGVIAAASQDDPLLQTWHTSRCPSAKGRQSGHELGERAVFHRVKVSVANLHGTVDSRVVKVPFKDGDHGQLSLRFDLKPSFQCPSSVALGQVISGVATICL